MAHRIDLINAEIKSAFDTDINIQHIPTKRKIDPIYDAFYVSTKNESYSQTL